MKPKLGLLLEQYVNGIYVSSDQSTLYLDGRGGLVPCAHWKIETEADCCSETWFADVLNPEALSYAYIIGVEILDLPNPEDSRTRQESDSAYGFTLKTNKGVCTIIYRNSSNGYYCGDIRAVSYVEAPLPAELTHITTDWSA